MAQQATTPPTLAGAIKKAIGARIKAALNKPNMRMVQKLATRYGFNNRATQYFMTLRCPFCHQKTLYHDHTGKRITKEVLNIFGTNFQPHYVCFNPKCSAYYLKDKKKVEINETGQGEKKIDIFDIP